MVYVNYGDNEEKKRGKNEKEENEAPKAEPLEQSDSCKPKPRCHPGTHYTVPLCHPGTVTLSDPVEQQLDMIEMDEDDVVFKPCNPLKTISCYPDYYRIMFQSPTKIKNPTTALEKLDELVAYVEQLTSEIEEIKRELKKKKSPFTRFRKWLTR